MKIFKSIDEKFEYIGFCKTREDAFGASYEKDLIELPYIHVIDIVHKANGYHLIQSYQRGVNSDGFNNMVGITSYEAKLCREKMKKMGWKDIR